MATGDMRLSIAHQTRFALRLTAALSSPSSSTNTVFSPLSLHVALSLLAAGAGGATRDQLLAALGGADGGPAAAADTLHTLAEQVAQLVLADGSEAGGPRMAFADAVFVDASLKLKPAFEKVAVGKYKAETQSVDFQKRAAQVAAQVNSWVEKVTSGLIQELLPPGSVEVLMKPPGWFLAMRSISKELGRRSSMHLKRETVSSTFLMGVQSKHLSCPAQTTNILRLMTPLRSLSFHTSRVGTRGSSPCT